MEVQVAKVHQNINKEHKCEICETVFNSKQKLNNHFRADVRKYE